MIEEKETADTKPRRKRAAHLRHPKKNAPTRAFPTSTMGPLPQSSALTASPGNTLTLTDKEGTTPSTAESPTQYHAEEYSGSSSVHVPSYAEGIIEVSGKGFGFLREARRNFAQSQNDVFVTPEVVRKHGLRDGMKIKGETRRGSRGLQLFRLIGI